ncbi:MAG: hypothetical protein JO158_01430 [Gammaproteobacteria bacterium]|nr:hypothetical protein [Gammaproteobacteria bacterium]
MRRPLLALLLAAALTPAAPAHDPLQAIDDCLARLDSEIDVGYARIAARCPDLSAALTQSPFAPWLPADWERPDNELSAAGLSELRAQLTRESAGAPPARAAPRIEHLASVLAAVTHIDQGAGRSWWQRLKDWLHGLIATHPQADDAWLSRWLTRLNVSTSVTELIGWSALAVVVALAASIIVNELRLAGVLRRPAHRPGARAEQPDSVRSAALADIERAPAEEQPRLLLELIALRLAAQQRLAPTRALTARELERQARLPGEAARAWLAELVAVCERVRFAAGGVTGASLAGALQSGRRLLLWLEGAPSGGPAQQA